MKTKVLLTYLTLALVALALAYPKTDAAHASVPPSAPAENVTAVPLYWLTEQTVQFQYNAFHFYTVAEDEKTALLTQPQWSLSGIVGYVFPKQVAGTVPLYRLVKNEYGRVNHFMTIDKGEADDVANNGSGWQLEGICCYVSRNQVAGTVPLYHLYHPEVAFKPTPVAGLLGDETSYEGDVHFYTADGQMKYRYIHKNFQLLPTAMYVWMQPTDATAATTNVAGMIGGVSSSSSSQGGNVIKNTPAPPFNVQNELFSHGCSQNAGKKQVTCPTVEGWELCNYYKTKGELNVSSCTTTADQFAFAAIEKDLSARGCSRFLGRAGQYLCQTLNGAQACDTYAKKKDGLVTKCLSVKQAEMNRDLGKHGCGNFLGRDDDFLCKTDEGVKACEIYRIDGRVKMCRRAKP